jgi:hypothetical protein
LPIRRSNEARLSSLTQAEYALQPETNFGLHQIELRVGRLCDSLEKVVGTCDPDQALWFECSFKDAFQNISWAVLVVVAADEELGLGAFGQKLIRVVSALRVDGNAEADETLHSGISTAGAQADVGAEGEAGEEDRTVEVVHPVESCENVVLLAEPIIVSAFAEAYTAEVETKDGKAKGREGLHGVIDNFVVHGSAARGVRMTDERGVRGVVAAGVEKGLETTGGAAEIVDRPNLGGSGLGHLLKFIGCVRYPFFMGDTVCWRAWRSTLSN